MAKDPRFWHPTIGEWRAACELHDDWDPRGTLMKKDGTAMAIWLKDAPLDDVKKGKEIQEERREQQRQELARTKEEAEEESLQNAILLEKYRKRELKQKEYAKVSQKRHAEKMKAVTADDPFVASVANAVDKDKRSVNANHIIHAKRLSDLPRIALSDADAVRERIDWYYQLCVTDGVRPNLPGLALCFGLTRTGLMNAMTDRRMPKDAAQELGRGIAMLDEIMSALTLDGRLMPVASIYLMNNWLGYKNASEVTTRTESIDSGVDQKALEQKYQTVIDME
jgi:hypothetical protein